MSAKAPLAIHSFYKHQWLQYAIHGFFKGQLAINQNLQLNEIALNFIKLYADDDEDFLSLYMVTQSYIRTNKEYWDAKKSDNQPQ